MTTRTKLRLPQVGVLLAGGASSRMGQDKAELLYHGRPLIAHMLALLEGLGLDRVVVSGDRAEFAGIADISPFRGPLGGLASVAMQLPDAELLVVPVDMPQLGAVLLSRLQRAPAAACVHFVDLPLPMRLRLDAPLRDWLGDWLADLQAPRALHRMQTGLQSLALPLQMADQLQLGNANTPADWERMSA